QLLVPAATAGLLVERGRSIDFVRRFGSVHFDNVRVPRGAAVGEIAGTSDAIVRQLQLALVLQSAETVGAADRVLEFTMDYARDRYAFGRPIASFQALKHRMADMLLWLESSKAIADVTAESFDRHDGTSTELVSVMKAYVADRCLDIIDDCV